NSAVVILKVSLVSQNQRQHSQRIFHAWELASVLSGYCGSRDDSDERNTCRPLYGKTDTKNGVS
ncbi:MAG: hypothetical protein MUC83_19290, partial [Pirellula sp.]|nr:hypothetical protein [Pirellula sp.]